MPVPIQRRLNRRVTQLRLDRLHVHTLGDQERREGVPQIVEPDVPQPGASSGTAAAYSTARPEEAEEVGCVT